MVNKTKKNTTQYELDTNNVNKTSTLLQTSGGKDEIYGKPIYLFRNIFHEVVCVLWRRETFLCGEEHILRLNDLWFCLFIGWFLSMEMKNAFFKKIPSLDDLSKIMALENRFEYDPDNKTTIGGVVVYIYIWLITGFVAKLTLRVPLVEQELFTIPEHLSSPQILSGVRVTQSFVLCVCFVDRCLSFCPCSFGHCVVCSSSMYGFWLPLWYLQTLLIEVLSTIGLIDGVFIKT